MTYPKFNLTGCLAAFVAALCIFSRGNSTEAGKVPHIDPEKVRLARKLISEGLNSDHFLVREQARETLPKLGRAAIEPLEAAMHSEVSEVRLRAIELLIALRGRGLLGIQMMTFVQPMPEYGAGVASVLPDLPAEKAGMQGGDVIVELNGLPVDDNNTLMWRVFSNGPARVMDVVVKRGDERMRFQVLVTLNMNNVDPSQLPPVRLESELPASDDPDGREQARVRALRLNVFNQPFVQVPADPVATAVQPAPPPPPEPPINMKEIEAEFDRLKMQEDKEQADEKGANTAAK